MAGQRYIGTKPVDAGKAIGRAVEQGQRDGKTNYPPLDSSGIEQSDYFEMATTAEATTTATLTLASHLAQQRIEDDRAIAAARGTTAGTTATALDARTTAARALADWRAFEDSVPLAAKPTFWPAWLAYGVLFALSLGTFGAVTAALGAFSFDQTYLLLAQGIGASLVATAGGAGLASLLRMHDTDSQKPTHYSPHTCGRWLVVALVLAGLGAMAWAVAGIRTAGTNAETNAVTTAPTTIFIPGQPTPAPTTEAMPKDDGVDRRTWLYFELAVAAVAVVVEYQRSDPRTKRGRDLARHAKATVRTSEAARRALASAIATHEAVTLVRADHDSSAVLLGAAHRSFALALAAAYRRGNLSERQMAADPFVPLNVTTAPTPAVTVAEHVGCDLAAGETKGADAHDRDAALLSAAYKELEQTIDCETQPGRDLRLDPAVQALDAARGAERAPNGHLPTTNGHRPRAAGARS